MEDALLFTYKIDSDLVLRLPHVDDAADLLTLFENDRAYLTYWNDWPKRLQSLQDCQEFILKHRRAYAEGKSIPAAMIVGGTIVGICSLEIQDQTVVKKAELSYWISEASQGKGLVTRTCEALLKHAFESLGLNRVFLRFKHVDDGNENGRSRRVAERLGFSQEGVQRHGGVARGEFMDMVVYSILADEWRAR